MGRFKLAFVGGGLNSIAGYIHFVASRMDNKFEVCAGFFSRNEGINRKTAEYWGVERFYNSFKDLMEYEKENIDALVILSPTPTHLDYVIEALKNNIPVICEKPLVSNMEEILAIEENVKDIRDRFLVVTYNYLAYPMLIYLKNLVEQNFLGNIISVNLEMPQESFLRPPKGIDYPPWWRKKDGRIPTIALDLASHLFSILKTVAGKKISSVKSIRKSYSKFNVVDDIKALLEFSDGTDGYLWVSKVALGNRNGMKIALYGTEASAVWIQEEPEKLIISNKKGERIIIDRGTEYTGLKDKIYNRMIPGHPAGFIEAFANLYFYIHKALEKYKKGEDFRDVPLIWDFYKEKENFEFLEKL